MTIYVKKSCPTCSATLEGYRASSVAPGVRQEVDCPRCGTRVVLRDDPSFADADAGTKVVYGFARLKTLGIMAMPLLIAYGAYINHRQGIAAIFVGIALLMPWALSD